MGTVTRNVIIQPYILRRLDLVYAAITGSSRHLSRVARVPLPTLAIIEVLLLRLHHLLLVQLTVVVWRSDARRGRCHLGLLSDFAGLYRIDWLSTDLTLIG